MPRPVMLTVDDDPDVVRARQTRCVGCCRRNRGSLLAVDRTGGADFGLPQPPHIGALHPMTLGPRPQSATADASPDHSSQNRAENQSVSFCQRSQISSAHVSGAEREAA